VAMSSKKQSNLFAFFGKANTPKNEVPKSTQDALITPPTATSSRNSRSLRSADAKRLRRRIIDDDSDSDAYAEIENCKSLPTEKDDVKSLRDDSASRCNKISSSDVSPAETEESETTASNAKSTSEPPPEKRAKTSSENASSGSKGLKGGWG
jgi:hypothetical protein